MSVHDAASRANLVATAPGKLIVSGEYAVLDGAPAVVIAVDRRVVAHVADASEPVPPSPFLTAVAAEVAARYGARAESAAAARRMVVDSRAFYRGDQKLGLGSSAAVTVAATARALAGAAGALDRDTVLAIALAAHAAAQGARGARGSGADIAAAVYGGTIVYGGPTAIQRVVWPEGVRLIPFFTGISADTATLVTAVIASAAGSAATVAALAAIGDASRALTGALAGPPDLAATATLAALRLAAAATDQLARATGLALVPPAVLAVRAALAALGGTAKTTGAGGGDVAVAVLPATADATVATAALIQAGCLPLPLIIDPAGVVTGVDTRPLAS